MTTARTVIEIDQEALEAAAEVLGTITASDTVNVALQEVSHRPVRLRALARLGDTADSGDFDEFAGHKPTSTYRP
jgi:Arc/MetJ family transcription regulator